MPKRRLRGRRDPKGKDEFAFTPPTPRSEGEQVRFDPDRKLTPASLAGLLERHGVTPQAWMFALEDRIGGMLLGEAYGTLSLGFRCAFTTDLRTGTASPLPRTPDGRALLRVGVEGDMLYFVTEAGEAWAQEGIADKWPHREAASFEAMSAALCWPAATRP